MSSPSSTNAVSPVGSSSPDLGDVSAESSAAFSSAGNELLAEIADQNSSEGLNLSTRQDPSTASRDQRHTPAMSPDDEDAISSVSQTTAVPSGLRSDLGTRVQTRAREIEEELSRYCVETGNRIPVNARHFIMARVFELVQLCSDLRADAACERGAVMALQGQLLETRREAADMHRRAVLAEARTAAQPFMDPPHPPAAVTLAQTRPGLPAGLQGAPPLDPGTTHAAMTYAAALRAGVPASSTSSRPDDVALATRQPLQEHVAFVTPIVPSATPARDSLRLLKDNIDPVAHNIRDVTLRHTRYGLTVFARTRETLTHMRQAIADNAITCAALSMRIPEKRHPHCAAAVHVYTDGSFSSLSAGAAFVVLANLTRVLGVGRFKLTRATSAYTAEVVAIREAVLHALSARYTLPALASQRNAEPHVLDLRVLLRRLSRSVPLHVFHVPGHSGVFGNEVADFLAQRAAVHGHDRSLPLPFRAVRQQLRRETLVLWTARWRETSTRTELFRWVQDVRALPPYFPSPAPLVTLLTGHGRFPHYFYRFNIMREPRCPCGSYCLDMSHVLHACTITAPYTNRIEPQEDYRAARYYAILCCPRNRALLIGGAGTGAIPVGPFGLGQPSLATLLLAFSASGSVWPFLVPCPHDVWDFPCSDGFCSFLRFGDPLFAVGLLLRTAVPPWISRPQVPDAISRYQPGTCVLGLGARSSTLPLARSLSCLGAPQTVCCGACWTLGEFIDRVRDRNPQLQLDPHACKVRASFRERSGTSAIIAEVDPEAFKRITTQQRISVGWTSVRVTEDLHVPTCTFCATYGHGRSSCPLRNDPARAVCMRCASEGHVGTACTVRLGDPSVACAECRRAGLDAEGHPTGHPQGDCGGAVCVRFAQINLDHARRAFTTLVDTLTTRDIRLAAVNRRLPALLHGYLAYAVAEDPGAGIVTPASFDFVFISAYAPTHSSLDPIFDTISEVLRMPRSRNVILAGDFNAKHQLWRPMETDERGLQVSQFTLSFDLVTLNDSLSLPTFETPYSASWIDLTFATPSVLSAGYEWLVMDDTTYSEHRLLEVRVGGTQAPGKRLTTYARLQLLEALRRDPWFERVSGASLASSDAIDRVLDAFYVRYTCQYQRHLRPVKARPTSKPWFTPALTIERAAVAAKRRRFQRARDPQMRVVYRREYTSALAEFRRHIREARFKEAFGRLHQFRCLPTLIAPDGTQTSTHLESAALLLRTQIAVDDPATDETSHASTRALAAAPYTFEYEDVPFTYTEAVDVLRNTPNKSASGPDLISPIILKALFRFHPRFFLMLFNASLALGYFPRCWRRERVSFIHKRIGPSSVFGKTLERLLNGRLQYFREKRGLVHPRQYGFRRGRSSLLALHALKEYLTRFKTNHIPALLMSLDFHGALAPACPPLLSRAGPPERTGRSVFIQSHAGQVKANPTLGSPQGSPLSPLLWNIVIDSLLSLRMPPGFLVQAYADDTIIVVPAPSRDALGNLASDVLRRVIRWSRDVKVSLNCDKTFCVLFSQGVGGMECVHPVVRLAPDEPTLQFREHLRDLGVIFDRRLSFFHHADYLRQKVALFASRVATFFAMQRCYVRPAHKLIMYRQVILPALTYGSPVWWSEDHVDCHLQARLLTVQRVALLALTRAYRTTSTAALQVLMHSPPIDLELERVNAEFRLFTLRRHVAFGACRFRPSWVADAHEHATILPSVPAAVPFMRLTSAQARVASRATAVYVYTDGSFSALSAGAAFVVLANPTRVLGVGRFKLTRATSAYTAEVVAFREAVLHAISARYTLPVAFYTDCLSLLQALASQRNAEPHVADFLAQRAAIHGHDRSLPLPFRAVRQHLRRETLVLWTARWRETSTRTELFRWVQDVRDLPSYFPPPAAAGAKRSAPTHAVASRKAFSPPYLHLGVFCQVGLAQGPFRWGPRVSACLASQRSFTHFKRADRCGHSWCPAHTTLSPQLRLLRYRGFLRMPHRFHATATPLDAVIRTTLCLGPAPPDCCAIRTSSHQVPGRYLLLPTGDLLGWTSCQGSHLAPRSLFALHRQTTDCLLWCLLGAYVLLRLCLGQAWLPMATSRAVHEVLPAGTASPVLGGPSDTPCQGFSPEGDSVLADLESFSDQGRTETAGRAEPTAGAAHTCSGRPTTTVNDEDDAGSSVSEVTAVGTGLGTDPGMRLQARSRELADEVSRFCADSTNRITVRARNYVMTKVLELVNLCSDMRADTAMKCGAALALQGQLVDAHREIASLQRQVFVAERPLVGDVLGGLPAIPPVGQPAPADRGRADECRDPWRPDICRDGRAGGPAGSSSVGHAGPAGFGGGTSGARSGTTRSDHVAFLTPVGATETPARDVVSVVLLKANIDPVAKEIRDMTLRYTRYGVTVFSHTRLSIVNLQTVIQDNTITRAAITVRVPDRRHPHVKFSGVDPEIGPEEFLRLLNERNPSLAVEADLYKVKVRFQERGGTKAYVIEVDPDAFQRIMASGREPNMAARNGDSSAVNLDHARLSLSNLCDHMVATGTHIAVASDLYRPKRRLSSLPAGCTDTRPARKVLLYRQVLLPALTYASPMWWSENHVDCRLYARMVAIQRVALLVLTPPAIAPFARLSSAQARAASRAHAIHVFTDGSYTSTSAGAAYVIFALPDRVLAVGRYRLLRTTSAYSAEVIAFREALKHVIAARYLEPVALYTDCLSLLQALASPRKAEPHVLEIRVLIRKLSRYVQVYVYHVTGHAAVFGNQVADFIAERAARRGAEISLPFPFRAVRNQLRRELLVLWTIRWRADNTRTELYRWVTDLRTLPSFCPPPPSLVTHLTGHGRFLHYFFRFNIMREPRCPCGSYCLDMSHGAVNLRCTDLKRTHATRHGIKLLFTLTPSAHTYTAEALCGGTHPGPIPVVPLGPGGSRSSTVKTTADASLLLRSQCLVTTSLTQQHTAYETVYAASWIDVTLATPSALAAGYTWQSELLGALAREAWFPRVTQPQPASSEALDSILASFYRVFNQYLKRHLRPVKSRTRGNSWWTPDLALERKRVNAMRRRFQRCGDPLLRSVLRQDYTTSLARFRLRGDIVPRATCIPWSGKMTRSHQRIWSPQLVLQTQIAVESPVTDLPSHAAIRQLVNAPYDSSVQDVPFTETEVSDGQTASRHYSSGLFRVQRNFVMLVLNTALRLGYFPHCWRTGRIIFIPKPGRPPQRTTTYRPICVNSVFGKTLERHHNGRLYFFLWKNGHIHDNQFGFTHARSAVVAIANLKTRLLQLKASKLPAILMALDFQGAFDSVWHPLVLKFFRDRRLSGNLYNLLKTFLHDRTVVFTSHAGSPLSPML
ncbi:hypothetical protein HPB52_016030 [Rhipicephalus sanguineus]|uniref:Uncharacterized protein n=1 Tax=Rhipicephalus sanguineus TaxID=34632 RepID=A0A9D4SZJ2_RHISA|nr:hypothetical protein HPB52_016030 [Rhipicephalus sanguineus]